MILGTKIFFIGLLIFIFSFVLGQLAGREIPKKAKTFIGGLAFTGMAVMVAGGIGWIIAI